MAIGIGWLLNGYRHMLGSFRASLMDIWIVRCRLNGQKDSQRSFRES